MEPQKLAPIVLFVYNRPLHTEKVLKAIGKDPLASKSTLFIFADGPKENATEEDLSKILRTREVIKQKKWCKEVFVLEEKSNKGLAESIVNGITTTVNKYGKVIVLEDDIVISPFFLTYMNEALSIYEKDEQVMHVGSFVPLRKGNEKLPNTFFLEYMNCWGWATWKRAWQRNINDSKMLYKQLKQENKIKKFNLDNSVNMHIFLINNMQQRIKTWGINWYASIFLSKGLCLYPKQSLTSQIGLDGSGTHCGSDSLNIHYVTLAKHIKIERIEFIENKYAFNYYRNFYLYGNLTGLKAMRYRLSALKANISKFF